MGKFAIIGLGKFGMTVASTLFANGAEVVAIDVDERFVEEAKGRVTASIQVDSTDESALKRLGLGEMDGVVLAIGNNIEVSVLTSVILKKLGAGPIYAKVDSQLHGRILEMIGVQHIVFPEEQIGLQLAHSLVSPNIINYQQLSSGHSLVELQVPSWYVGKNLQELALPTRYGVHIVAIRHDRFAVNELGDNIISSEINDMPGANDVVEKGDTLVLIGPEIKIKKLIDDTNNGGML